MDDPLKEAASKAVLRLLEPLAQGLLELGLGVGHLQALAEMAFVSAARTELSESGDPKPDNVARIAVQTGLSRNAVTELLASRGQRLPRPKPFEHRADRVLRAWCTESDYLDSAGNPAVISIRGAAPSFQALVKQVSKMQLSRTILKDLQRVGAVRRVGTGHVQVIRRTYGRTAWDLSMMSQLGEELRDHLRALLQSLRRRDPPAFHRYVVSSELGEEQAAILERDFSSAGNSLFKSFENALAHESSGSRRTPRTHRLSASITVLRERNFDPAPRANGKGASRKNSVRRSARTTKNPR